MRRLFLFLLLAVSSTSSAIVIRHDVDDSNYCVPASEFPALADMPGEAHGVLIAPQWIVTAAHTITGSVEEITLNGVRRKVERLIVHPGYKKLPDSLIAQAIESGNASKAMEFQASNKDIALVKLVEPVEDVAPAVLYQGKDELGKLVMLMGKGATGNGADGEDPHSPHRAGLRRAFNQITNADGPWLGYVFNRGPSALALEGMGGGGDSGGPVLIKINGQWQLAGLAAWKLVQGDAAAFRPGVYGQTSYNVRLSSYLEWMETVMSSEPKVKGNTPLGLQGANNSFKPKPLRGSA